MGTAGSFEEGHVPWNKGKKKCFSKETIRKMSDSAKKNPSNRKGTHLSEEAMKNHVGFEKGHTPWNKDKEGCFSEVTREKMSRAQKKNWEEGKGNGFETGHAPLPGSGRPNLGKTSEQRLARVQSNYLEWRKDVFKRDNYTCQSCFQRGGELQAHHIKSFSRYPELRCEPRNGITLCKKCHADYHRGVVA